MVIYFYGYYRVSTPKSTEGEHMLWNSIEFNVFIIAEETDSSTKQPLTQSTEDKVV